MIKATHNQLIQNLDGQLIRLILALESLNFGQVQDRNLLKSLAQDEVDVSDVYRNPVNFFFCQLVHDAHCDVAEYS